MHLILAAGFAVILITFWLAHQSNSSFNALDLIMEDRKVSRVAFAFMLVLGVSTWVIVDQQIKGRLSEGIFGLWIASWVTPLVAKMVFGKSDMPAGTIMTSTMSVTQETTEKAEP